jgi:hypothetical protein
MKKLVILRIRIMKCIPILLIVFFTNSLFGVDVFIPNVNVPAGCYPSPEEKYIYHMYDVVQITGLETGHRYYITRDDNSDFTPYLSYIELLYYPGGGYIRRNDFVVVGNGGDEGLLYEYTGTSSTAYFDYNFEIPNSSLIYVGGITNRPAIRIREYGSYSAKKASSIITIINASSISGPSLLCSSSSSYSLMDQPYGSNVNWEIRQNGTIKSQGSGTNAQATNLSNGSAYVLFNIEFNCGSSSTQTIRYFWVGPPILDYITAESGEFGYSGNSYAFAVWPAKTHSSDPDPVWNVYPSAYIWYNQNSYAQIQFDNPGWYDIWAYAENICGSSDNVYYQFEIVDLYMLSPNPASNEITITVNRKQSDSSSNTIEADLANNVIIYDLNGTIKSQKEYFGEKFNIPVYNLQNGNYLVEISNGKSKSTKHLIIKH